MASKTSRTGYFTEITDQVKLDFVHEAGVDGSYYMPESIGSGGAFLDYDNDGDLDIYLINGGYHGTNKDQHPLATNRLFRQNADGTFVDVTAASGLGDTGYGMGCAIGDFDNDGHPDVYVTNYGPDALYRNHGDGTFTNVTKAAGIDNSHWACSAIFFDYDRDGFLDLYVANYLAYDSTVVCTDRAGRPDYCGPTGFPAVPDKLYHNNGNGTFTDVSLASNIARVASYGLGVVSADFNADGWPDVYVANDREPNFLWINQKNGTFKDEALPRGAAVNALGLPAANMGVAVGDIDNDEDMDLFITHLREEGNALYRNIGDGMFQDDSSPARLAGISLPYTGFGTGFFDYDHDGDLDLAVVNGRVTRGPLLKNTESPGYWDHYAEPNFLFENEGSGKYRDASAQAASFSRQIENSRGLAFGDVDNDGDIDLLVTNEGGRARLFRNDVPNKGHWLLVRALDLALKRDAIGAKVFVEVSDARVLRYVAPGYSYLNSNEMRVHFGLGAKTTVERILVEWPGGAVEMFPGVASDQIITLQKGQGKRLESLPVRRS
ncbi:MAG: CRTAC1 family protein [bacterium]